MMESIALEIAKKKFCDSIEDIHESESQGKKHPTLRKNDEIRKLRMPTKQVAWYRLRFQALSNPNLRI